MRLVDFDSTGCVLAVLGRWPPQGHQTPQAGAQHCGPPVAVKIGHPLGKTSFTTGRHAYGSVSEKLASSYAPGDACNSVGH